MVFPCFRALYLAEGEIQFIDGKRRLACRLESCKMRAHLGKHGAVGIGFSLPQQELFQNRHIEKLGQLEFLCVVMPSRTAPTFS